MNIDPGPITSTQKKAGEYAFSDADFRTIADLANKRYGLHLQQSKKALVYSRLAKRLRALDLSSFRAYCDFLDRPEGDEEQSHLLSALTTNVTHFFREKHHFDFLRTQLLPGLVARAQAGGGVRLWSSACSAGQEAYCIAAMICDACPDAAKLDMRVLATDIDPQIIEKAKAGTYPKDQLSAIPTQYHSLMVEQKPTDKDRFFMQERLRKLISFGQLNLVTDWPMRRPFDVIFCRNAAIYFDKDTQSRLWQRFADALSPNGHLMIGHSERLCGPAENRFKSVDITTYQKINATGSDLPSTRKEQK